MKKVGSPAHIHHGGVVSIKLQASTIFRKAAALSTAALIAFGPGVFPVLASPSGGKTATPIKHLVVVFQENISFDHYFGTYPNATNPSGEPPFFPQKGTPTVIGYTPALLNNNPNLNPLNGAGASNPFRLDRSQGSDGRPGPRL